MHEQHLRERLSSVATHYNGPGQAGLEGPKSPSSYGENDGQENKIRQRTALAMRMFLTRLVCALLRPFNFRGKGFLIHQIAPRQGIFPFQIHGYKIDLDLHCLIQRGIYFGVYEPTEARWVEEILQAGDTFVDVGANVGFFTLIASARVGPEGRVLAFEPNPNLAKKLRITLDRNNIHNVTLLSQAVSDQAGVAQLYFAPFEQGIENASLLTFGHENGRQVEVTTLDKALTENNLERVDLLKLDVEGLEGNVLRGCREHIRRGVVRRLIVEFNANWLKNNRSSNQALYDEITELGFRGRTPIRRELQNILFEYA